MRATWGRKLAALAGLAILLAGCGDSVPKIQLASPSAAGGAAAQGAAAGVAATVPTIPPAPTATPDTVATALARAQAAAGSGVSTGATVSTGDANGGSGAAAQPGTANGQAGAAGQPVTANGQGSAAGQPGAANGQGSAAGQPGAGTQGQGSSAGVPVGANAAGRALPAGSRLRIPSIGVDAPIVSLGVDTHGVMEVPSNGTDVGWYTFSAVPGAAGNAVISGHLDTATSTRAVFYRLKELKNGDPIYVTEGGKTTNFEVFWSKAWPDQTAPLALILGNAPSPTLTLITCDGTFDRSSRNYNERLVVRAKLPGSV